MQNTEDPIETVNGRKCATVTLEEPIAREGGEVREIKLMRPRTGDLRGLLIADLLQMKVDAVAAVLPRVSVPTLAKHEVDDMDPADLVACAVEVASFLVPKSLAA